MGLNNLLLKIGLQKIATDFILYGENKVSGDYKLKRLLYLTRTPYICTPFTDGAVAQSVEQRTENPCVAGSIPAHTTERLRVIWVFFYDFY